MDRQSKSEEPISLGLEFPEFTGQPTGGKSWGAEGGIEPGVFHAELRAPADNALDQKQTAGKDRATTSKNLRTGSDLEKSLNSPLRPSQIRTTSPPHPPSFIISNNFKESILQPPSVRKFSLSSSQILFGIQGQKDKLLWAKKEVHGQFKKLYTKLYSYKTGKLWDKV